MSKNNYQKYAEEKQPQLLSKTITLNECIKNIKNDKLIYSEIVLESEIQFVAKMFDLNFDEVKHAVENEKYWCI